MLGRVLGFDQIRVAALQIGGELRLSCERRSILLEAAVTFDEWLSQRLDPLLGFAVVLCGDRHLAEDVVQDVLVKAQTRWDRIQDADRPEAYLRRMVVNEYLSWRRKWSRIVPRAEVVPAGHLADPADSHADREELIAELLKLPRRQRTVLVLRYYCGQSDAEIAEMLGWHGPHLRLSSPGRAGGRPSLLRRRA